MNSGKSTTAQIKYEVGIQKGPCKFVVAGIKYELADREDICVIRCIIESNPHTLVSERIVGVVGDEWRTGCKKMLLLREFLNSGGIVGLNKDLVT